MPQECFFFFLTSGFGTALLLRFLLLLHTKQSIPKEEHDCLMGKQQLDFILVLCCAIINSMGFKLLLTLGEANIFPVLLSVFRVFLNSFQTFIFYIQYVFFFQLMNLIVGVQGSIECRVHITPVLSHLKFSSLPAFTLLFS